MRLAKRAALALLLVGTGACAQAGQLGGVLGGIGAPAPAEQLSGTIQGVDTRAQQVFVRTTDGQTVGVAYDDQTQVVYNNQNYPVTALDPGDQVLLRLESASNGGYYTDLVQVTQPVNGSQAGQAGAPTALAGTVQRVDAQNGWFTLATQANGTVTVTLPYNPRTQDVNRLRSLRSGDYVRVDGSFVNQSRFELQRFE